MNRHFSANRSFNRAKQRGVVLFFALVALVVMSLAAVALIRSVDTSTLIAGNLAFRQSAATAGDIGGEAAMNWLSTQQAAATTLATDDAAHVLNQNHAADGYYSTFRPNAELTNNTFNWSNSKLASDANGNTVRYIIERMCTNANDVPTRETCLLTIPVDENGGEKEVANADGICKFDPVTAPGCPSGGYNPYFRITARVTGARGTVSYIQSFVY